MTRHSNGFVGGDDRLRKSSGDNRTDRDSADLDRIAQDGTALTAAERRKLLRAEFTQEILPSCPPIPGWHLCWLSTNSKGDPIHARMRLGYVPVKSNEVQGLEKYGMTGGEWDGMISCNEMLLFKIPNETYQDMMTLFHHDMPLENEEAIRSQIDGQEIAVEAEKGVPDGFNQLAHKVRTPTFI
jgi:hypothetical protein